MGQAFGILSGVHRTHAEWEESSQNAGQRRIRSRGSHLRDRVGYAQRRLWVRRLLLWRMDPLQPFRETILAINHSLYISRTACAERLAASTAIRRGRFRD